ncbi:aldose epimerase family protein [Lewinella sp. 4G2]|uniref:aldose epimerase family protein n=1 Tax=Lewinella sp. 4G2 TaxID=1803372 RepID=UPI0007B4DF16|nr:aldose epimerase family protein [Lewinella sp. 4G2]OAV44139.1 hypothetical protein A3850_006345 [Lewinella sp. 4G2]
MSSIKKDDFGVVPGQGNADLFTLINRHGNTVKISTYGATITSIVIDGAEMVIGYDNLEGYLGDHPYFGACIGRYGNRIAKAQFSLNGHTYELVPNEGIHQLHGGPEGFDKQVWMVEGTTDMAGTTLVLKHVSEDGHMGFPGRLTVLCSYTWDDDNALTIDYSATSDQDTILNLTNHAYFNIGAAPTVRGQEMQLWASQYTPIDDEGIPTGEIQPVDGTPFDFRVAKPIDKDLHGEHPQVQRTNGYDHNFVVDDYDGTLRKVAHLRDPETGRQLSCFTTEPGLQVFTANFAAGQFTGRDGQAFPTNGAICLETQHFPNSPNQANFRTPYLGKNLMYETKTVYRFS